MSDTKPEYNYFEVRVINQDDKYKYCEVWFYEYSDNAFSLWGKCRAPKRVQDEDLLYYYLNECCNLLK